MTITQPRLLLVVLAAIALAAASASGTHHSRDHETLWRGQVPEDHGLHLKSELGGIVVEVDAGATEYVLRGNTGYMAVEKKTANGTLLLSVIPRGEAPITEYYEPPDVTLVVPAGSASALALTTTEGDIEIIGATGPIEVTSESGQITWAVGPDPHPATIKTATGHITLLVDPDAGLVVDLATSGEITVDYSIVINYVYHQEPAKLGRVVIGDGLTSARVESRRGNVSILRRSQ